MSEDLENITKEDIVETLTTMQQHSTISSDEIEELKNAGLRDINAVDVSKVIGELTNQIQITEVLEDHLNQYKDKKSPRDILEKHIKFLKSVSIDKTEKEIVDQLDLEHAKAILKTTSKIDLPDNVIKKHLRMLKKKYN